MITKLRTLSQFSQIYNNLTWLEYMISLLYVTSFIITRFLYSYMSFLYVMWSRDLLKLHKPTSKKTITSKLGGNTYKNERVAYLHMTWIDHAKVIKATVPKVALVKGITSQQAMWFLIIWYHDKWKEHMQLLQKLLDIKFGRKKHIK